MIPATTGKPYNTRHHISEADALALDPQAQRILGRYESRELPETPRAHSTGDVMGPADE